MHLAIRRVLPPTTSAARAHLPRPHQRLSLSSTVASRIRTRPSDARGFTASLSNLLKAVDEDVATESSTSASSTSPTPTRSGGGNAITPPVRPSPNAAVESGEREGEEGLSEALGGGGGEGIGSGGPDDGKPRGRGRPLGAKTVVRRVGITVKHKEEEGPRLPEWFVEGSVRLRERMEVEERVGVFEDPVKEEKVEETKEEKVKEAKEEEESKVEEKKPKEGVTVEVPTEEKTEDATPEASRTGVEKTPPAEAPKPRYQLHDSVWQEMKSNARAGLSLPKRAFVDSVASKKAHLILHMPKEGGIYFMDAVVEKLAAELRTDLVRIDAQDLAEIGGDYIGDSAPQSSTSDISPYGVRSLGYDTQSQIIETVEDSYAEEDSALEPEEEEEEFEDEDEEPFVSRSGISKPVVSGAIDLRNIPVSDILKNLLSGGGGGKNAIALVPNSRALFREISPDRTTEKRMQRLLDVMISSAEFVRQKEAFEAKGKTGLPEDILTVKKTIIHLRDYRELERTGPGQVVLKMLHDIIASRRAAGEPILVIGTSSAEEVPTSYSRSGVRALQSRPEEAPERIIVVPPRFSATEAEILKSDRDARVREVNIRHLRDVIRRKSGESGDAVTLEIPKEWHRSAKKEEIPAIMTEYIWNFDHVHRIATLALGRLPETSEVSASPTKLTIADVASALEIIEKSDSIKYDWALKESLLLKTESAVLESSSSSSSESPSTSTSSASPADDPIKRAARAAAKARLAKIAKTCNSHEKKLLAGVMDATEIQTTFSSIRAPSSTIEAMKTLTTLSLIRPDSFKYGVLSTDRIPGVLLYGPPGTGKTLLAKAVAKESGATVLEIDGASVTDMYVGESEKNVKAIFSLARKLEPCVVFVDEADALFGARQGGAGGRTSHRETINQFLKEWADMEGTAFIMVATNRPFDLDDAILRRLPRRILLDLPTAEDREAIFKLHLTGENLAADVDLAQLARDTPMYSGSDCKNLAVAAALNCVKDEIGEFEKSGVYPEKRTLRKEHFERALREIGASVSDDERGTLKDIRAFDEKYGEKRKKKGARAWGFELGQGEEGKRRVESRVRMD